MLVSVRKLLENWVARGFFALLVMVFVFWGISNVVTLIGSNTAVAHVGGGLVDVSTVQAAYQKALNQQNQSGQGQPDLATRQQMASDALSGVLRQQVLRLEEQNLGVRAPDDAIRQAIHAIPAFQTNGVFDETKFTQVLTQNNSSPDEFIGEVRDEIAARQLIGATIEGVAPPAELVNQLFDFVAEQRFAETVTIPFTAQPAPTPPADAVLQRYWRNHPAQFTAPEYRTIKLVILSPALVATQENVAQADIDAAYARAAATQPSIPLRSVQVIVADNLAASSRLEAAWKHNPSWTAIQAMAKKFSANPVELDHAQQSEIPTPELGAAVFAAAPGEVIGPVAGPTGMFIFKVTDVGSSGPDEATLKAQIKQQLQLQKAQSDVAQDVDNLQDALAGQTPLDKLPGNLGLVAVQGTLDANGNTSEGTAAPIPGGDALKAAVVKAAFAAHLNDPAQLTNGPEGGYFALTVDTITPPALQPYNQVQDKVLSAWTKDEIARAAEVKAAQLLAAVNNGKSLDDAASAAGDSVTMTPAVTRNAPASGVTDQMIPILFSLKLGKATMLQTDTGFTVAALAKIVQPAPAQAPADYAQLQQAMAKSLQNDVGESFLAGLQTRDKVRIDQNLFAQIYQ
jgi:peptidyl-prolyl cis-trans isomerase D